ncbi:MAG: DUF5688 family protein [Clostridium sp.]|jgi:hypothetical protein|nr:DUF5688 family protein [Clostridium sp.]
MKMSEFSNLLREQLQLSLGEETQIRVQETRKNNGVLLHGLMIERKDCKLFPTIYLETFKESFDQGTPLQALVNQVLDIYENALPQSPPDMEFFSDFEKVKGRIAYKLINASANEELLGEIPHIKYLDMAICFYYLCDEAMFKTGSILLYNTHLEMWHTTVSMIYELAKQNTPVLLPLHFDSLASSVSKASDGEIAVPPVPNPISVVSNEKFYLGAAAILYPETLEMLYQHYGNDYYVIPSSIHEVLTLSVGNPSPSDILQIIVVANQTQVSKDEFLSNSLYQYSHDTKRLDVVSTAVHLK